MTAEAITAGGAACRMASDPRICYDVEAMLGCLILLLGVPAAAACGVLLLGYDIWSSLLASLIGFQVVNLGLPVWVRRRNRAIIHRWAVGQGFWVLECDEYDFGSGTAGWVDQLTYFVRVRTSSGTQKAFDITISGILYGLLFHRVTYLSEKEPGTWTPH